MSWRNSLACDSAPLVCRDPLPFGTPQVLTGYLLVFHILWCGLSHNPASSQGMETSCQNFHHAEGVGTALGKINPCHVALVVFLVLSFPGGYSCLCPHCCLCRAKPCWWSGLGVSCAAVNILVKKQSWFCQRSKIFQQGKIHLSMPQVLLFPWQKSPSESPWSPNPAKAQHELDDPCWPLPTQEI